MSVEQAIHNRWKTYRPLTELLPACRFATGWLTLKDENALGDLLPYATLERKGIARATRTSGGRRIVRMVLTFHVWTGGLDEAKTIAARLHERFSRRSFSAGDVVIQDMKQIGHREVKQPDAAWHTQLDYLTQIEMEG